jgi:hypothetical protein
MISAAVAPTARADDFSDILANIEAEQAAAQADFSAASAEFATGTAGVPAGLTDSFEGLDDDTFSVGDDLNTGLLDSVYNVPGVPADTFEFTFATPANDTAAVTEAQAIYTIGNNDMTTEATDFAAGDYTNGTVYQDLGAIDFRLSLTRFNLSARSRNCWPYFPASDKVRPISATLRRLWPAVTMPPR